MTNETLVERNTEEQPLLPDAPAEKRTQGPQTYVVQIERQVSRWYDADIDEPNPEDEACWQDVATVTVPPRTARKTVVTKGLEQAGITPDPDQPKLRVRVLDADSAFVHEPEAKQPPAEWRI